MKDYEKVRRLDLELEELYDEYHYIYFSGKVRAEGEFMTFQEWRKKKKEGVIIKVKFEESGQGLLLV